MSRKARGKPAKRLHNCFGEWCVFMALIRKTDLRAMPVAELQKKLGEIEDELSAELRTRKSSGKPANPGKYRQLRKLRARIKTLLSKRGVKA